MRIALTFLILLAWLLVTACRELPQPTEVPSVPVPSVLVESGETEPSATSALSPTRHPDQPTASVESSPTLASTMEAPRVQSPTVVLPSPTLQPISTRRSSRARAALNEYQRGVAYTAKQNGAYRSLDSDKSLDMLFATGANYVSILVTWYQYDYQSTDIHPTSDTPSDAELAHVVDYAHLHGVRVLLKPQLDFSSDPMHWRGQIDFSNAGAWQDWFDSYRRFILYYAAFAQQHGVEELSVGTELESASRFSLQWRAIIRSVRAVYSGLLTYSANHSGEEVSIAFWNDLDFIGVNNFYHLTNYSNPTVSQLVEGWKWPIIQLQRLHDRFPRQPIIFTEVGYPSLDRANIWPWNWNRPASISLEEQARCYEALFRVWWQNPDRPWFRGLFIWNWLASPNQGGTSNGDYTPHGKPAEDVLRAWFADSPTSSPYFLGDLEKFQAPASP